MSEMVIISLALLGMWVSYRIGVVKGRAIERNKTPKPITPTCPCSHIWGEHKEGGSCKAQIKRPYYSGIGSRNGHEWVECACTKYHGPIPITSDFFNPGTYSP